jgi:hypothetical protein
MTDRPVRAPELYAAVWKCHGRTPERDEYLRENKFVDPAILAADLGLTVRFIVVYLRKLGLRTCERREMT